jgi:hypothetical protein
MFRSKLIISVTKVASGELITASPEAYAFFTLALYRHIYYSKQSVSLHHLYITNALMYFPFENNTLYYKSWQYRRDLHERTINKSPSGTSSSLTSWKSAFSITMTFRNVPKPTKSIKKAKGKKKCFFNGFNFFQIYEKETILIHIRFIYNELKGCKGTV